MRLFFQAPTNKNGNAKQIEIDTENKAIYKGYFIFNSCFCDAIKVKTNTDLDKIAESFEDMGYTYK